MKGALASSLANSDPQIIRRADKRWAGRRAAAVHSLIPCLAVELPPVKAVMMRVSTPFPSFVIESLRASDRASKGCWITYAYARARIRPRPLRISGRGVVCWAGPRNIRLGNTRSQNISARRRRRKTLTSPNFAASA